MFEGTNMAPPARMQLNSPFVFEGLGGRSVLIPADGIYNFQIQATTTPLNTQGQDSASIVPDDYLVEVTSNNLGSLYLSPDFGANQSSFEVRQHFLATAGDIISIVVHSARHDLEANRNQIKSILTIGQGQ